MKGGGRCSSREDKEACNGDRRHNVVCRNYRCAFHSHLSQSSQHLPFVALVVITTPLVRNAFHPADLPSSPTVVVRGERIVDIEQHDESSRVLSQNDLLVQTLGIEHWVVCMAWVMDRLLLGDEVQIEETQRMLLELQIEVATEKLK
ncbi:hypothetical protein Ahy_B01g056554 isoform C [Arachis hypogaea]|uniref:Uncharacterized protein n=1 Tax=Arachis hypogaea TaxID=3818 RepID=A0A445AZ18_ARAHY|nr:hypothetical protein Ahy_B01g056554 isoform C [Arachis hypogaea]